MIAELGAGEWPGWQYCYTGHVQSGHSDHKTVTLHCAVWMSAAWRYTGQDIVDNSLWRYSGQSEHSGHKTGVTLDSLDTVGTRL